MNANDWAKLADQAPTWASEHEAAAWRAQCEALGQEQQGAHLAVMALRYELQTERAAEWRTHHAPRVLALAWRGLAPDALADEARRALAARHTWVTDRGASPAAVASRCHAVTSHGVRWLQRAQWAALHGRCWAPELAGACSWALGEGRTGSGVVFDLPGGWRAPRYALASVERRIGMALAHLAARETTPAADRPRRVAR